MLRKGWLKAKERQAGTVEKNSYSKCPDLLSDLTVKKYLFYIGNPLDLSHRLLRTFHSAQEQSTMNQIPWENQGKITQDNGTGYRMGRGIFKDGALAFHWILKSFRLEGAFKSTKSNCSAWFGILWASKLPPWNNFIYLSGDQVWCLTWIKGMAETKVKEGGAGFNLTIWAELSLTGNVQLQTSTGTNYTLCKARVTLHQPPERPFSPLSGSLYIPHSLTIPSGFCTKLSVYTALWRCKALKVANTFTRYQRATAPRD